MKHEALAQHRRIELLRLGSVHRSRGPSCARASTTAVVRGSSPCLLFVVRDLVDATCACAVVKRAGPPKTNERDHSIDAVFTLQQHALIFVFKQIGLVDLVALFILDC